MLPVPVTVIVPATASTFVESSNVISDDPPTAVALVANVTWLAVKPEIADGAATQDKAPVLVD